MKNVFDRMQEEDSKAKGETLRFDAFRVRA